MTSALRTELPYREDSAMLFDAIADLPWAVFLDSGDPARSGGRYDILAAGPSHSFEFFPPKTPAAD